MCGICGVVNVGPKPVSSAPVKEMMLAMKHRGPDDEGIFNEDNVALGFVRLSIIDLSMDGHQPMLSDDERFVMVYNGEIFNYIELRSELEREGITFKTKTDSEVLLKSFVFWGQDCLHRLNGMWAFVIYDRKDKTIFAARDRFGVKPFYYHLDENKLIFASEIPPILSALDKKPLPNHQAIFDYLVFNRTDHNENTFFEGIKKLQHGCKLQINAGKVSIARWYHLRENLKEPFKTPAEYRQMFASAVSLRLRSDVPVGVCLSGGLDSSSIVTTLLTEHNKKDLNTFSAIYKEGQTGNESRFIKIYEPSLPNMFYATPTADELLKDLFSFVKAHAEPIPSTSPYAQYKVMELAKKHVVVTLDGQGADEQLAGYHYFFGQFFKDLLMHGNLKSLAKELFYYLKIHKSLFGIKSFLFFMLPARLRTMNRVRSKQYLDQSFVENYNSDNSISDGLYGAASLQDSLIEHFEYKLEHLLKWEDRNSMFFSIEARTPFLDYRLVERTLSLPNNQLIRNGATKHILREAMKGILPEQIRMRQDKIGFGTPQDEWFREPAFHKFIVELFSSEKFNSRVYIKNGEALRLYHKHLSKKGNFSKEIWKLIHLELWFRQFID